MRRHLLSITLIAALSMTAAPRELRLADFTSKIGYLTLGGEFPGAQGELTFENDGKDSFARLDFDLSRGNYVGYLLPVKITEGSTVVTFEVRTSKLNNMVLIFRAQDATGQEQMQMKRTDYVEGWTKVTYDLSQFEGHWGGANDGKTHWPIKLLMLGISVNRNTTPKGHLDIRDATVTTTASNTEMPSVIMSCRPSRFGSLFYPDEDVVFDLSLKMREMGKVSEFTVDTMVTDWRGEEVFSQNANLRLSTQSPSLPFKLTPSQLKNRFGAFKIEFTVTDVAAKDSKLVSSMWFARLPSGNPRPVSWIGSGIHGGHGWGHGDFRFLDILEAVGIGVVREDAGWGGIEREKGVYKPSANMETLATELRRRGIELNLILDYTNNIYENPCDPVAFAKWCKFMASHFKGRIRMFEIWNEPQNFMFKKQYGSDDQWIPKFVELTHMADEAVRSEQPDAVVAVTAEDSWPLLKWMLELGIAKKHNTVSFHPYCHGQPRPEYEMFFRDNGKEMRQLALEHGGATHFSITEAGWTTYEGEGSYLSIAGGYPKSSYVHQAQFMIRMYLLSRQLGIDYACQYDFKNDGSNRGYTEHNFGIVHEDYSPKPALAAIAYLARSIGEAEPCGDLSFDPRKFRLYQFKRKDGDIFAAYAVNGDYSFTLPDGQDVSKLSFTDLMGNTIIQPLAGRDLTLTETPVYIQGLNPGSFHELPRMEIALSSEKPTLNTQTTLTCVFPTFKSRPDLDISFQTADGRSVPVKLSAPRMTLEKEQGMTLAYDFTLEQGAWEAVVGQETVCTVALRQGTFTNRQQARFRPERTVNVRGGGIIRRNGACVAMIDITCNSSQELPATLLFSSTCLNASKTARITLQPGRTTAYPLVLDKVLETGNSVQLKVVLDNGFEIPTVDLMLQMAVIPKVPPMTEFRGSFAAWEKAMLLTARPIVHNEGQHRIAGASDLSVMPKVAWCEEGLLLSVAVMDDVFFQPYSNHGDIWRGDSLQFAIATEDAKKTLEVTVAKLPQETRALVYTKITEAQASPVKALCTRLTETAMLYEVCVPWDNLPGIRESKALRLSLLVNDNDGKGRKGWIEYHSGIGVYKDAGQFGVYSLE